jgi:hypothetical protein
MYRKFDVMENFFFAPVPSVVFLVSSGLQLLSLQWKKYVIPAPPRHLI